MESAFITTLCFSIGALFGALIMCLLFISKQFVGISDEEAKRIIDERKSYGRNSNERHQQEEYSKEPR